MCVLLQPIFYLFVRSVIGRTKSPFKVASLISLKVKRTLPFISSYMIVEFGIAAGLLRAKQRAWHGREASEG